MDYTAHCKAISKGAGKALGGIISKVYKLNDFGFYNCVVPILDYGSSTWAFKAFKCIDNIQNRCMRYYLGLYRFPSVAALTGDTGWLPSMFRQWLTIIRFGNGLILIDENRSNRFINLIIVYARKTVALT